MSNRLGYETIHTMVNLRREWKLKIMAEHINASRLINNLLGKYWEYKVCHYCYSDDIHTYNCKKCGVPVIICDVWETSIEDNPQMCPPTRQCKCPSPGIAE